jgi:hypothetical protein
VKIYLLSQVPTIGLLLQKHNSRNVLIPQLWKFWKI